MAKVHGPIRVEVYKSRSKDPKQRWRWRAIAANGRKVANSGEGYVRAIDAEQMAEYLFNDETMTQVDIERVK